MSAEVVPEDRLPLDKCLNHLATIRHAKWLVKELQKLTDTLSKLLDFFQGLELEQLGYSPL